MALNLGSLIPRELTVGGLVANGYYVRFYEPDGAYTTLKTVYQDAGKAVAHADPLAINASGFAPTSDVYADGLVDIKIYDGDPDGLPTPNTIRSRLNVGSGFSAVATDLSQLILNHSFETETSGNGTPDNWTLTPHANITVARSTSSPGHGAACLLFTVSGAGTATALSSLFEVSQLNKILGSFLINTSTAALSVTVSIAIYDSSQSLLSTQNVYLSTDNPTSWASENLADILLSELLLDTLL